MTKAKSIYLFGERNISFLFAERLLDLKQEVYGESAQYLLNVDEPRYVAYLAGRYHIEPFVLDFDCMEVGPSQDGVQAGPAGAEAETEGVVGSVHLPVSTYRIPYKGAGELLRCIPSAGVRSNHEVAISADFIYLGIIDWESDPAENSKNALSILDEVRAQAEMVLRDIQEFNHGLADEATAIIRERRAYLAARETLVLDLGGKPANSSRAASRSPGRDKVEPISSEKVHSAGETASRAGKTSPARGILETIHELGKGMERFPVLCEGKDAEALRDYIILMLEPRFGSGGPISFTKAGKTGFTVQQGSRNLLTVECRFWKGPAEHGSTIDYLLSRRRSAQSAVVLFVDRTKFAPILTKVRSVTESHPCCERLLPARNETWSDFEFHQPDRPRSKVPLATLVFHLLRNSPQLEAGPGC